MTCRALRFTALSKCFVIQYWPVKHQHYNDTLYECTVSLIHLCACYGACRVMKLWWNNGKAQGELEEASHAMAKLNSPPQNIILIQLITEKTSTFLTPLLTCVSPLAAHTHTHTLNGCLGLPSLFVCVFFICSPMEEVCPFSPLLLLLNQHGSSLQDSFQFGTISPDTRAITLFWPSTFLATLYGTNLSLRHRIKGEKSFRAVNV